jgi:hypothetical protein
MRRINWPFAVILIIAFFALLTRTVLNRIYEVPSVIRWHFADFGSAAFFTAVFSTFVNLFTPPRWRVVKPWLFVVIHMVLALAAASIGFRIEYGEKTGTGSDGGFDPGQWIIDLLGLPDTDTYDPLDLVAIVCGGIVVVILQWLSTRRVREWARLLWFIKEPAPKPELHVVK